MEAFDRLAEERIREAIARGMFDDLPGKGQPLELEDLTRVPRELRASYMLLKSAGVLPEEMQLRKEALRLGDLLSACTDEDERASLAERRSAAILRYEILMERRRAGRAATGYEGRVRRRLSR